MTTRILRATIPLVAALATLSLTACGQKTERAPATEPLQTFVGKVDGSSSYIGLITDGKRLSGFVTDGGENAKWFATAELDGDGKAPLVQRDGYALGEATVSDETASGEVLVGLASHSFDASLATGESGLFTAAERNGESSYEAGWVLLPDGSERGTYDTYVNQKFTTHPAPRLKPTVKIPGFGASAPHPQTSLFLDLNTQAP
jgi:hypothetical protein